MHRKAFTLIELLIVVAIIAILAAIAVPNFLEAQTRSKVSRCKADMRSLGTAMESYRVDFNGYMPDAFSLQQAGLLSPGWTNIQIYAKLTTPVAYMTSIPGDVFYAQNMRPNDRYFLWKNFAGFGYAAQFASDSRYQGGSWVNEGVRQVWVMYSMGPDLKWGTGIDYFPISQQYDPSNGTISGGDVSRWGP